MNWSLRFVDTGYWLAIYNIRDTLHPRARTLAQRVRGPLLTTTAILFEVADGLASPQTRHLGSQYLRSIRDDPSSEMTAGGA